MFDGGGRLVRLVPSPYTGYAGGSSKGGAASMLCFPMDPQWLEHSDGASPYGGLVYCAEYKPNSRHLQFFGKDLVQHDVPCSVCNKKERSSIIMIPGKTRCHVLINTQKIYRVGKPTMMATFCTLCSWRDNENGYFSTFGGSMMNLIAVCVQYITSTSKLNG